MLADAIFWDGIENLSLFIEWFSFYIIVEKFNPKKKDKLTIASTFALLIAISVMLKMLNINPNERIIISFIIGLIFYKFNFKCNIIKCIMISLMFWLFMLTIEALSISLVVKINVLSDAVELLNKNIYRVEAMVLSKVILLAFIIVIKCLKLHIDIGKSDFLYMITPLTTNIVMILVIFGYAFSDERGGIKNNVSIFFISILLLLSNMSLMFIVSKIIKNNKLKLENEFIKNKLEVDYKYYSDLQVSHEKIKRLYHDMKNHIICIEETTNNNSKISKEYLSSINKELDRLNVGFNTGNEVLDVILNNKREVCAENNIDFRVVMDFSKVNFVEYFDICTIFSNSLDNAIEACNKVEEYKNRWISLKGTYVNNFYIVKIENSKINKVKYLKGEFLTDKKDKFLHGIGLKNIRIAVEKYDGEMIVESNSNKFTLKILIPIRN